MKSKKITIEDLAVMVQKGFEETSKKSEMEAGFRDVNKRLDRIENILIKQHEQRISRLEEALAIK